MTAPAQLFQKRPGGGQWVHFFFQVKGNITAENCRSVTGELTTGLSTGPQFTCLAGQALNSPFARPRGFDTTHVLRITTDLNLALYVTLPVRPQNEFGALNAGNEIWITPHSGCLTIIGVQL